MAVLADVSQTMLSHSAMISKNDPDACSDCSLWLLHKNCAATNFAKPIHNRVWHLMVCVAVEDDAHHDASALPNKVWTASDDTHTWHVKQGSRDNCTHEQAAAAAAAEVSTSLVP